MNGNDFVKLALRSPLQAMMGDTMLITVTGRKTGRKITLPVGFYREGNTLWIISSRDRTWWRNIGTGAEVDIHLHGRDLGGFRRGGAGGRGCRSADGRICQAHAGIGAVSRIAYGKRGSEL